MGETHKETLNFLFSSADEAVGEDEENPHAQETTHCPEVIEALREEFGDAVIDVDTYAGEDTVLVKTARIAEFCRFLKEERGFEMLNDLGGVDRNEDDQRFEVYYQLVSIQNRHRLRLKVFPEESGDDPTVPSITSVYRSANWNEREAWDMFGIRFEGHPDHRRMYMPEDFDYRPLRKEFPPLGIPGSLPLPSGREEGEHEEDPFPSAHGKPPIRSEDAGEQYAREDGHAENGRGAEREDGRENGQEE